MTNTTHTRFNPDEIHGAAGPPSTNAPYGFMAAATSPRFKPGFLIELIR